ncbi:MAG: hypothetical protein KAS32_04140 [Candidatus Peribacteraceae bacterium]|nr:hypothetical protein [Candidatus Peribacteraceae bacterium]
MNIKKCQEEFNIELFKIIGRGGFNKKEINKVIKLTPFIAKKFKEILEKVELNKN